ncbi:MAG: acyltransferase [Sulfurospirillaceae bacterium]|nr:acyltransferase [Sulfurospirillaceae bacterium]MDD3463155.1 acyltransferase [Sulfurospirillaceae bacterium]
MSTLKFDVSITNASKGFALMLILWHHLFYEMPQYGFIVHQSALLAKVCVAIYVVLSGYGLAESVKNKPLQLWSFYKRRVVKLYSTYWFIALIFVPIGVFFMGRTLQSVFGEYALAKFGVQMLGLHMFSDVGYGYNATWWFMSLIVALYLIFPLLNLSLKHFPITVLVLSACILFTDLPVLNDWIFPFAVGIYLSQTNGFSYIFDKLQTLGFWRFVVLVLALIGVAYYRQNGYIFDGIKIDALFAVVVVLLTTEAVVSSAWIRRALEFIGVHSFNIFLFHTFIYYYYWGEAIYYFKNPVLIFAVLLGICLVVSIALEAVKKRLPFFG